MKEIKVASIKEGTVLDHINSDKVFKIIDLLGFQDSDEIISCAKNLESTKLGKKGLVKISNKFLTNDEVNIISIISPEATLSIIKDYAVESKIKLEIPDVVHNILLCNNPNCITNAEQVATRFTVLNKKELRIKCSYCEHIMEKEQINLTGN